MEYIDNEGYLTGSAIEKLRTYSILTGQPEVYMDVRDLIEFIKEIWCWAPIAIKEISNELELHTGGWSGNEDIIEELKNTVLWHLCWWKTEKGGHYYFKLRDEMQDNEDQG